MIQLEQDYQGLDYSANLKAINPSPADLTGVYLGSYLQSVTPRLALGVESIYQRPNADQGEVGHSLLAKYTGADRSWIATAQVQPATGVVQATYHHRLSEKVDVAADLMLMAQPQRRDALATLGAKWDLRMSTFRAQVDSSGKVSALLEQRFSPEFTFVVAGEIDHLKVSPLVLSDNYADTDHRSPQNAAKVGLGLMLESTPLTPEQMGMPPQPY
jgi:mitochondrial import receptor subunit TOM40